jgi:hypothetical protein
VENIDFWNRLIKVDAAYSKTDDARCGSMTETLTAALKSLKMSAAGELTAAAFGPRQMTKAFASRLVMAGVALATPKELMRTSA